MLSIEKFYKVGDQVFTSRDDAEKYIKQQEAISVEGRIKCYDEYGNPSMNSWASGFGEPYYIYVADALAMDFIHRVMRDWGTCEDGFKTNLYPAAFKWVFTDEYAGIGQWVNIKWKIDELRDTAERCIREADELEKMIIKMVSADESVPITQPVEGADLKSVQ